ncbi:MAG: hypothetical protein QCI38_00785 [Candidatus Thermoplasmatota archaeon]|nr:hypothetical protein [Candidatus Thermoplasmatota archaeon]
MIGIITFGEDDQVELLAKRLGEMGEKYEVIDLHGFPKKDKLYMTSKKIVFKGQDLLEMDAFYLRQLGYFWPVPPSEITKEEWMEKYGKYQDFITKERECLSLKHSLIRALGMERLVVNPYESFIYHKLKPLQLFLFIKKGLPVPEFVAGNDLDVVKKGEMIYKALGGGIHAHMVDDQFIPTAEEFVSQRPGLFQDFVKGCNIRVYALGDEVIGAGELLSGPQVDSRIEQKGVKVVELPEDVKEVCLKAKELLGMHFSGIDLMKTEKDEYSLLECNPSAMFFGFEHMTGIPISRKIAEYLVENGRK